VGYVLDVDDVVEGDEEQAAANLQIGAVGNEVLVVPDRHHHLAVDDPLLRAQIEFHEALAIAPRSMGGYVRPSTPNEKRATLHYRSIETGEPTYNCAGDVGVRVEIDNVVARSGVVAQIIAQGQVRLKLRWDLH
jgi:hypothetical protein